MDIEKILKYRRELKRVQDTLYNHYIYIDQANVYKEKVKNLLVEEKELLNELKKIEIE